MGLDDIFNMADQPARNFKYSRCKIHGSFTDVWCLFTVFWGGFTVSHGISRSFFWGFAMDLVCPSCQNSSKLGIKLSNYLPKCNWNFESNGKKQHKGLQNVFCYIKIHISKKWGRCCNQKMVFRKTPKNEVVEGYGILFMYKRIIHT